MNQQTKYYFHKKTFFSTQKHCKTPLTKITKLTNKQKHEVKQSLLSKLQSVNLLKSAIDK